MVSIDIQESVDPADDYWELYFGTGIPYPLELLLGGGLGYHREIDVYCIDALKEICQKAWPSN